MTENNRTSHAEPAESNPHCAAFGAAQGRPAEEPQDVRLSGRGVARDRGGDFQLHGQENARAAGCRERAATAAHVAGQHRQQRAGLEEPGSGRARKKSSRRQWPPLPGKIRRSRLRRPRNRPPPRPLAQAARHPLPALLAGPADKRSKAPCRRNLLPRSNKRSSLPRKSASGPTTPDSLPTLFTPVRSSNSHSRRSPKVRRCLSSTTIPSGRQRTNLADPKAEKEQEEAARRL